MRFFKSLILFTIFLLITLNVSAQSANTNLSVKEVQKLAYGTSVYGYSTLDPSGPKKFTGKYWGVLSNVLGPGHNWIVIELNGEYFKNSGIIAGQSGSPVFVQIKGREYKIGTVSYGENFTKNPIAYLTPINEVLDSLYEHISGLGLNHLTEIKNILVENNLDKLLMQGAVSSGKKAVVKAGVTKEDYIKNIKAGSVLGVQLAWGDFDFTGSGTVSHVDGDKIYMFGHPLLQLGPVEYRLVPARVLGVQASVISSHIVSFPIEDVGAVGVITQDREAGIAGMLGREPENHIPVQVNLVTSNGVKKTFKFNTISDSWAGPILIGLGIKSSVSSWSRATGNTTLLVTGNIKIDGETVEFNEAFMDSEFFRENFVGAVDSLFYLFRNKLAAILTNNFSKAKVRGVTVNVRVFDEVRALTIENVALDSPVLRSGDKVNFKISLSQPRLESKMIALSINIPDNLSDGIGKIVVGNADTIGRLENEGVRIVNLATLIESLNQKRKTDAIYVYLVYPPSRMEPGTPEEQENPSVKKISKRLSSNVEEYEISMDDFVINGERMLEFKVGTGNGTKRQ